MDNLLSLIILFIYELRNEIFMIKVTNKQKQL